MSIPNGIYTMSYTFKGERLSRNVVVQSGYYRFADEFGQALPRATGLSVRVSIEAGTVFEPAVIGQPPIKENNSDEFCGVPTGTEARVCDDIAKRQSLGIAKYGTTVEHNPLQLREWLEHAYQECLDQAVYLRRAMEHFDKESSP